MKYDETGESIITIDIAYKTRVCSVFRANSVVINASGMQIISIIVQKCRICKVFFARKIPIEEINKTMAAIVKGRRVSISVFITKLS
jgi:hypothetical protein